MEVPRALPVGLHKDGRGMMEEIGSNRLGEEILHENLAKNI
jgi:hypothetical protein